MTFLIAVENDRYSFRQSAGESVNYFFYLFIGVIDFRVDPLSYRFEIVSISFSKSRQILFPGIEGVLFHGKIMPPVTFVNRPPEISQNRKCGHGRVREYEIPELQTLDPCRQVGFKGLDWMGSASIHDNMAYHACMISSDKERGSSRH